MKNPLHAAKQDFKTDYNWNRLGRLSVKGAQAFPSASLRYASDKVPIVGWLPRYQPRWIISDVIAGLTVGLMLIPQALSYAKIATIPVEYGLASSWFPAILYTFMGTSKDLSTGPTSLIGLLTSEVVESVGKPGEYAPQEIASAVALSMGIYGLIIGLLKLGFLLDFISLPILSGFISAVAITIGLGQIGSLLGEKDIGDGTAHIIHDVFHNLPSANGYACAVGFGGIALLTVLEKVGKRWASKHKIIWLLMITRAFICLVLFTGISYGVNKGRKTPLFDIVKVETHGIQVRAPNASLVSQVLPRSIAVFIGAGIEHTAIARGFGVKNGYTTDQTQEVTYYGLVNLVNSFFGAMGVGGAMSRTAVNSQCNVKSPLSGVVTTTIVLITIFCLGPVLYWVPKATLAAIIICAVFPLISPPSVFYRYWKTSLADFISSMIALWVCLFVSTEYGIAASVGFNIIYLLIKQVFTDISVTDSTTPLPSTSSANLPLRVPSDTRIFHLSGPLLFSNAHRLTTHMTDSILTHHSPTLPSPLDSSPPQPERSWSVTASHRITRLRRQADITDPDSLPLLRLAVLDFTKCTHIDVTAATNLETFLREVERYTSGTGRVRFAGMSAGVRTRLERAGWLLVWEGEEMDGEARVVVRCYEGLGAALRDPVGRDEGMRGEKGEGSEKVEGSMSVEMIEEKV